MHKKASHGKISEQSIKSREMDILNTVKFELATPSFYDFLENYLEFLIYKFPHLKDTKDQIMSKSLTFLESAAMNF